MKDNFFRFLLNVYFFINAKFYFVKQKLIQKKKKKIKFANFKQFNIYINKKIKNSKTKKKNKLNLMI